MINEEQIEELERQVEKMKAKLDASVVKLRLAKESLLNKISCDEGWMYGQNYGYYEYYKKDFLNGEITAELLKDLYDDTYSVHIKHNSTGIFIYQTTELNSFNEGAQKVLEQVATIKPHKFCVNLSLTVWCNEEQKQGIIEQFRKNSLPLNKMSMDISVEPV